MNEPAHPFRWIPQQRRKYLFIASVVATLLVSGVLTVMGQKLQNETVPHGIVSYEFAGDLVTATAMIESWGESGRILAGFHLGLDYLFLVLYSLAISLGCAMLATFLASTYNVWTQSGVWIAWAQPMAALLDSIENAALYALLVGSQNGQLPQIAWWCAAVKFAIVILGLLYVIIASIPTIKLKRSLIPAP